MATAPRQADLSCDASAGVILYPIKYLIVGRCSPKKGSCGPSSLKVITLDLQTGFVADRGCLFRQSTTQNSEKAPA
jgi:hypothetical protein